ncbi:hypothetical protein COB55_00135 [Candidatus Wolfebacteria bacterium]|nr:MAG: hypothetical protein COB55_00135 [Candidatus Wolfebacteria bacterium]
MFKQSLLYIIFAGIFAVLLTPFIVDKTLFFPFITGKAFYFRTIVEIISLAWILLALKDESYRPRASWIAYSLGAFLVIIGLADLLGENPLKSIWSNFERMEGYVTLLHLGAYFIVLATVINTKKLWNIFFNASVLASVGMSVFAIFQLAGKAVINQGGVRVDGTFGNASYLAIYLLFNIFITAFLFSRSKGILVRWWYSGAILLQGIILYYTATRGAFLGLLAGIGFTLVLMLFNNNQKGSARGIIAGVMIAIVLVGAGLSAAKDTKFVQESDTLIRIAPFISLDGLKQASLSRVQIWNMAFNGFKERPLLGWGQENFNFLFNTHYSPEMFAQEQWFDRAHNVFFDWLTSGGILGLTAYLALFITAFMHMWIPHTKSFLGRVKSWFRHRLEDDDEMSLGYTDRAILSGLFVAYFVHNLFVFDNTVSYIMFFTILAFLHSVYHMPKDLFKPLFNLPTNVRKYIVIPVVIIVFLASSFFFVVQPVNANRALLGGLAPNKEGIMANLESFKKAVKHKTTGGQEIREQLVQFSVRINGFDLPDKVKTEIGDFAEEAILEYIEQVPNDARLYVFLSTFYSSRGDRAKELDALIKALELSPKKQQIMFGLGAHYVNTGNVEKGFEVLKEAYDLAPEYREAVVNYAATALYQRRTDIAYPLLIDSYGTRYVSDARIIQAYNAIGDIVAIILIYEELVKNNPNDSQNRTQLAAAYLQVGRRGDAVTELREAIKFAPEFKEQGEYFIAEILAGRNP